MLPISSRTRPVAVNTTSGRSGIFTVTFLSNVAAAPAALCHSPVYWCQKRICRFIPRDRPPQVLLARSALSCAGDPPLKRRGLTRASRLRLAKPCEPEQDGPGQRSHPLWCMLAPAMTSADRYGNPVLKASRDQGYLEGRFTARSGRPRAWDPPTWQARLPRTGRDIRGSAARAAPPSRRRL